MSGGDDRPLQDRRRVQREDHHLKGKNLSRDADVTALSSVLMMEQKRKLAGGALPDNGESATARCGEEWDASQPVSSTMEEGLTLPPAMAIVMPAMAGMKATPDGKSLVIQTKSWTWTYTPTIVK